MRNLFILHKLIKIQARQSYNSQGTLNIVDDKKNECKYTVLISMTFVLNPSKSRSHFSILPALLLKH
jgi:hypothetical protein